MARRQTVRPDIVALPLLPHETLYVGVDVGKFGHIAGFLSRTLLARHERFEGCPTLALTNHVRVFGLSWIVFASWCPSSKSRFCWTTLAIILACLSSICWIWISPSTASTCKNDPKGW